MRAWLVLLPSLALSAPVRADPIAEFWSWFSADAARIHTAMDDERTREAMAYRLGRIASGLSYELRDAGRKRQLIISADGKMARFATVEHIVRAAPRIKGWKITALRPAERRLSPVVVGEARVDPDTAYFDLYHDGARLGVVLYLPGFDGQHMDQYQLAARRLFCQVLGERVVGQEIGFVDFDNQQVRDMQFSRPFSEFESVFDSLHK